jgi:hypothetical protein
MPLLSRKKLILVKTETTSGTDAAPLGTDALLVRNLEITPQSVDVVERELVRPYYGNFSQLVAKTSTAISFEVELAGSGTAGTAPKYDAALKACGLSGTVVATTSVTYAPVTTIFSSCTIHYNVDGVRHKMVGCRGTVSLNCTVGQIPTLKFDMQGLYTAPDDFASPAVTYTNQAAPLVFRQGSSSAFSFLSYAGVLNSFEFNLSNELVYRELVGGIKEVLLVGRKPSGNVTMEATSITTKDYFAASLTSTTGSATFLHGTTAGNKCLFTAPYVDITNPSYSDQDSVVMLNVPFNALPSAAGNDEFTLVFT